MKSATLSQLNKEAKIRYPYPENGGVDDVTNVELQRATFINGGAFVRDSMPESIKELLVMESFEKMCEESLEPKTFETLEKILTELRQTRCSAQTEGLTWPLEKVIAFGNYLFERYHVVDHSVLPSVRKVGDWDLLNFNTLPEIKKGDKVSVYCPEISEKEYIETVERVENGLVYFVNNGSIQKEYCTKMPES